MSGRDVIETAKLAVVGDLAGEDLLGPLINAPASKALPLPSTGGVVVGELVALANEGRTPLVLYPGQPGTVAVAARTVVDLHGIHLGCPVALMFDSANPESPIVMGVLREREAWPLADQPGQVAVDTDGERLIVTAKEQVVIRCGKASITLTKAGKVLIQGSYVLSRSSGVNRIKGGSVQLN
jgi:hypothetical protein